MRLIDADVLKENIEQFFVLNRYYHPHSKSQNIPKDEVFDCIDVTPTIKMHITPGSVWEEITIKMEDGITFRGAYRCPVCRYVEGYRANYCAKCGTRLKKEETNDS